MLRKFRSMPVPYAMRYSAQNKVKKMFVGHAADMGSPLSATSQFTVFVWNIHKQKRTKWLVLLEKYATDSQLVLLQEAYSTPELVSYATSNYMVADQVPVLPIANYHSGVMTLSRINPIYCCPLQQKEPIIRLHKSALLTVYLLMDGQRLMVANVHAVNFSLGLASYRNQLDEVLHYLDLHKGPAILAGDFNSWSRRRMNALMDIAATLNLKPIRFEQDIRKRVMGKPLDFIFYRNLNVEQATMLSTSTSDHNPMKVTFSVSANKCEKV